MLPFTKIFDRGGQFTAWKNKNGVILLKDRLNRTSIFINVKRKKSNAHAELLELLASYRFGLTRAEVAAKLEVSEKTALSKLCRLKKKGRIELVYTNDLVRWRLPREPLKHRPRHLRANDKRERDPKAMRERDTGARNASSKLDSS